MRLIKKWYGDILVGKPPEGCKYCALGSKVVIFVSGECPFNCYYCPVSYERRKDVIFADERRINSVKEAIEEAKAINALGAGITGGEPTLKLGRVIEYIKEFKKEFGEKFHIHLYTARAVPDSELERLYSVGLDEIRFHFPMLKENRKMVEAIKFASSLGWDVGLELPAIPGNKDNIVRFIELAIEHQLKFINLNEFEFTEANFEQLKKRGFEIVDSAHAAVRGSKELAVSLIKKFKNSPITIHFCSSSYKDKVQLRNRFVRRAKNYARSFDMITDEGIIVRGRIKLKDNIKDPSDIISYLKNEVKLSEHMFEFNNKKNEIYTSMRVVKKISDELYDNFHDILLEIAIIHQYPMDDGFITYLEPIVDNQLYS